MCLKINRSVKTPWHSPSMGVARSGLWAPENSQHFAMPPLIFQRNDVWRTNAEFPCWWRVTTLIFWLVEGNLQPIHRENSGGFATCLFTQDKRTYWEVNNPFPCPLEPLYQKVLSLGLIWKWVFIPMQIKLFFTVKVVHLASFWKWGFLELKSSLIVSASS